MVIRDGDHVRLLSRGGDYTRRFPLIVEAAAKRRQRQFIIDGEAVLLASHSGFPDFDACIPGSTMRRCSSTPSISLALDGEDLRSLPLSTRKTNLARLSPDAAA